MEIKQLLEQWQSNTPDVLPFESSEFTTELAEQELTGGKLTIQVLAFIGAWLGAAFFLPFLGLAGFFESEMGMLILGVILTAGAIAISYGIRRVPAIESMVLAVGMIGQILIAVGMAETFYKTDEIAFFLTGAIVQIIVLFTSFSSIQKFLSTVLIYLCILGIIYELRIYSSVHFLVGGLAFIMTYAWLNESNILAQDKRFAKFINPVGQGIAVSVIGLLVFSVNKEFYREFIDYWWLTTMLIGISLLYVVYEILREYKIKDYQWLAYASVVVLVAPTVFAPGIAASILILLLGFFRGHRILTALGVLGLIGFISMFYYNLQITLLVKSIIMFAVGFFFILVRLGIKKLIAKHEDLEQFRPKAEA